MAAHPLNVLSICAGGGGLDLGLELAIPSARAVCLVEREAFAVAHLVAAMRAGLLADAPVWSDARTFDGRPWRGVVDCLIGGIPCQPHSLAGRKQGSLDDRDLWSPTRRIIAQARPWVCLIENVAGMLVSGADDIAGAERVLRDLSRLGYETEAGLFTAAEVGAPHQRERLFILAVADHDHKLSEHAEPRERAAFQAEAGRRGDARGLGARPDAHLADAASRGRRITEAAAQEGGSPDAERNARQLPGRPEGSCGYVADPLRSPAQRRGDAGDLRGAAGEASGEAPERQRRGHAADDGGEDVADARGSGLALRQQPADRRGTLRREGQAARQDGAAVGHAPLRNGPRPRQPEAHYAEAREREPRGPELGLFPPGPGDIDAWAAILAERPDLAPAIEPGVRRVADGLASRVDRLRILGNGVVPLCAAYAIRTLSERFKARGVHLPW